MSTRSLVWRVSLAAVCGSATVHAGPTPWTFDFDASIADDPAYVESHLDDLKAGLPGLPDSGISEITTGQVQLYFFDDVADALRRAKDAGPETVPPLVRPPSLCVQHEAFELPSLSPTGVCVGVEQGVMAAFVPSKRKVCSYVEFPESYVYDHEPIGEVDVGTVSSWDMVISFAGEALTHVTYPEGLLPTDFVLLARDVIAKVRYPALKAALEERMLAYAVTKAELQNHESCFEPSALASFLSVIDGLTSELQGVEAKLDALHADGLERAKADRRVLALQGRYREDLPHPTLTDRERELLSFYVGGIYWRMRGAGLIAVPPDPEEGLLRRLLYVRYPYQLIGDMSGGPGGEGVGLSIFIQENYGYAEWYDMGTDPGSRDKYADLVQLTNRGKVAVELVAPQLAQRGYDVRALVAGGLQMGPCYFFIWEELRDFRLAPDLQYPYMRFLEWPTSTGEFCTGAALALGLTRTLLRGKEGPPCVPDCETASCGDDDGCYGSCPCGDGGASTDAAQMDAETSEDGGAVSDGSAGGSSASDSSTAPLSSDNSSGCQCEFGRPTSRTAGAGRFGLAMAVLVGALVLRARGSKRS